MDEAAWTGFERAIMARHRPIMEGLAGFLRLDTVSQNPEGVRAGGEWLARAMKARGLDAEVMETGGNPAVYGSLPLPVARRTVLIYCHFDVKPAPPAGWLQPSPFEPVLRRGTAEEGAPVLGLADVADDILPQHRLYARGASDDKGPIWAHLTALELMRAQGIAPRVALKFIFDGEEEMGSTHFAAPSPSGAATSWRPTSRS
jgi:acetylornithine deacetylase/succinyl-diaminopimelate desuccinylase-like protein